MSPQNRYLQNKQKLAQEEQKKRYIEAIEGFDGTQLLFKGGYKLTIHLKTQAATEDCPHGYTYEFNFFAPGPTGNPNVRVLGADNAHAPKDKKHPHDHWHATKFNPAKTLPIGVQAAKAIEVSSIEELIGSFIDESRRLLRLIGLDDEITEVNQKQTVDPQRISHRKSKTKKTRP